MVSWWTVDASRVTDEIRARVVSDWLEPLEQMYVVGELRAEAEAGDAAALDVLRSLRQRPDIFRTVANEIDHILAGQVSETAASPPTTSPFTVFISYRREDSEDATGRIRDRLKDRFGAAAVFMDIDSIPPGIDFRAHIAAAIDACDVVLVVIGSRWLEREGGVAARIHDERDFVRQEIRAALARDIRQSRCSSRTPLHPTTLISPTT